ELVCRQVGTHPLVHALIVTAEQGDAWLNGQLPRHALSEQPALRAEQEDRPTCIDRLHSGKERLWLHHHAGAAAIGIVIHHMVPAEGPVARVVEANCKQASGLGTRQDALLKGPSKHCWKERKDVEAQSHEALLVLLSRAGALALLRVLRAGGCWRRTLR